MDRIHISDRVITKIVRANGEVEEDKTESNIEVGIDTVVKWEILKKAFEKYLLERMGRS